MKDVKEFFSSLEVTVPNVSFVTLQTIKGPETGGVQTLYGWFCNIFQHDEPQQLFSWDLQISPLLVPWYMFFNMCCEDQTSGPCSLNTHSHLFVIPLTEDSSNLQINC